MFKFSDEESAAISKAFEKIRNYDDEQKKKKQTQEEERELAKLFPKCFPAKIGVEMIE